MDSILRAAGMYLALMLLIIGEATQRALLGLGTVDDVTLVQARDSASQARKLVKGGADPVMLRKQLTNPRDQEAVPPCKVQRSCQGLHRSSQSRLEKCQACAAVDQYAHHLCFSHHRERSGKRDSHRASSALVIAVFLSFLLVRGA